MTAIEKNVATPKTCPGPFTALLWKESRQAIPVFAVFGVLVITVIGLSTLTQTTLERIPLANQSSWMGGLILAVCVFSLTMALTLFAPEKENGTIAVLQSLPLSSRSIVRTKLGFGILLLFLFTILCMALVAFQLFALEVPMDRHTEIFNGPGNGLDTLTVLIACLLPIECFIVASLCSMWINKTSIAAFVSIGVLVMTWVFAMIVADAMAPFRSGVSGKNPYPYFVAVKALTWCFIGYLIFDRSKTWLGVPIGSAIHHPAVQSTEFTHQSLRIYGSLFWQSWQQRKWFYTGSAIALTVAFILSISTSPEMSRVMVVVPAIVLSLGSLLTFSHDQANQRYLFFQQHREYGRKLWLSRVAPMVVMAIATAFCAALVIVQMHSPSPDSLYGTAHPILFFIVVIGHMLVICLGIVGVGQFASLSQRSGILATAEAICLGYLFFMWYTLTQHYGESKLFFVFPIIVALFASTWWWAPRWLAGKESYLQRSQPYLVLTLVAAICVGSFVAHRAFEFPPAEMTQAEFAKIHSRMSQRNLGSTERAKLFNDIPLDEINESFPLGDQLNRLSLTSPPSATELSVTKTKLAALFEQFPESVEAIRLAGNTPFKNDISKNFPVLSASSVQRRNNTVAQLVSLHQNIALYHELNGEHDEAMETWLNLLRFEREYAVAGLDSCHALFEIIAWSERNNVGHDALEELVESVAYDQDAWLHHAECRRIFNQMDLVNWYQNELDGNENRRIETWPKVSYSNDYFIQKSVNTRGLPWEFERAYRFAHLMIASRSNRAKRFHLWIRNPSQYLAGRWGSEWPDSALISIGIRPQRQTAQRTAYTISSADATDEITEFVREAQMTRYTQTRLAILAHRQKHGEYPESLSELIPYLGQIPVEVWSGHAYEYNAKEKTLRFPNSTGLIPSESLSKLPAELDRPMGSFVSKSK